MKVSVIGTPGCGRTVFLGLLYETLVRMSTAEGRGPEVVVNTGPAETKALGDLRLELLSGRWPSPDLRSKVSGCLLELGFRMSSRSIFRSRELRKVRLENFPLKEKDVQAVRGSGQLREVLQGSPGGSIDRYGLSEGFREALESEALVLLADISPETSEGPWPGGERDAFLATVVDNASMTRLGKEREVAILVVLTKGDRAEADEQNRFEEMYPRTARSLRKAIPGGEAGSNVFVSWIGAVPVEGGAPVPAAVVSEGQVQIDYSEKEYWRLVERIGRIA
ncbi:MAG TPA: hypothetical protein PLQ92_04555 [Methanomassiliicoccales archaeon]|nr:hypothetical protein [Methanomassiliicoccales archaeon]